MGCGASQTADVKQQPVAVSTATTSAPVHASLAAASESDPAGGLETASCTESSLRRVALEHRRHLSQRLRDKRMAAEQQYGDLMQSFDSYCLKVRDEIAAAIRECESLASRLTSAATDGDLSNAANSLSCSFPILKFLCGMPDAIKTASLCAASIRGYTPNAVRIILLKAALIMNTLLMSHEDAEAYATSKKVVDLEGYVRRATALTTHTSAAAAACNGSPLLFSSPTLSVSFTATAADFASAAAASDALVHSHHTDWPSSFFSHGVAPPVAVDYLLTVFLYSVDWKECDCKSLQECQTLRDASSVDHRRVIPPPLNCALHGWNGALWAIANKALRDLGESTTPPDVKLAAQETLKLVQPFVDTLDEALATLPATHDVVFRGISFLGIADRYTNGFPVTFAPFTSTSIEGREAMQYANKIKGGTYFVIRCRSAVFIDFVSYFPREAEKLLGTYSCFSVLNKTSPTLLRLMQYNYDIVTLGEVPDHLLDENYERDAVEIDREAVLDVVRAANATQFIFDGYLQSTYVESLVAQQPPPVGASVRLLSRASTWLMGQAAQKAAGALMKIDRVRDALRLAAERRRRHLAVVGTSGSGKTSALLALYSSFLARKQPPPAKPSMSFYVPLGAVPHLARPNALDEFIAASNSLTVDQFKAMIAQYSVVILLDDIDEVNWGPDVGASTTGRLATSLLRNNPIVASSRVVMAARVEWLGAVGIAVNDLFDGLKFGCEVLYLQPFPASDIARFVRKNATRPTSSSQSQSERTAVSSEEDVAAVPLDHSTRSNPTVLSMLCRLPADSVAAVSSAMRQGKLAVSSLGVQLPCDDTGASLVVEYYLTSLAPSEKLVMPFFEGMAELAVRFLNSTRWECTVADARGVFSEHGSDANALYHSTPRRVENDAELDGLFSFTSKGITEFLIAWALLAHPDVATGRIASMFSRPFPDILKHYRELVNRTSTRRETWLASATTVLLPAVLDPLSEPTVRSNVLALLGAAGYPFADVSLDGVVVSQADLSGCCFAKATFRNASLLRCNLTGANFDGAAVDNLTLQDTTFEIEAAPYCSPSGEWVSSITVVSSRKRAQGVDVAPLAKLEAKTARQEHVARHMIACAKSYRMGARPAAGTADDVIILSVHYQGSAASLVPHNARPNDRNIAAPQQDNATASPIVALAHGPLGLAACATANGDIQLFLADENACTFVASVVSSLRLTSVEFLYSSGGLHHLLGGCEDGRIVTMDVAEGQFGVTAESKEFVVRRRLSNKKARGSAAQAEENTQAPVRLSTQPGPIRVMVTRLGRLTGAYASDGTFTLWKSLSGDFVAQLDTKTVLLSSGASGDETTFHQTVIALSRDELLVAIARETTGSFLEMHTLRPAMCGAFRTASFVRSMCFSASTQFLFAGCKCGQIQQFDVSTGECLRSFFGHGKPVTSVATFDASTVVSAAEDGTVRLWEVGLQATKQHFSAAQVRGSLNDRSDAVAKFLFSCLPNDTT